MVDDRLALMDQGSFLGLRALGHQPYFHATWTYDRPVDLDAIRRFNKNLTMTLLGRLVERSPLPFGRHRWVAIGSAPEVEVEREPRGRQDVLAWTNAFGDRGADPEHGPGWRIGVVPLTDGGAAVTLIIPHTLGDGLCVLQAIEDAVEGRTRRPSYPGRHLRRRRRVLWEDLAALVRELPGVARGLVAGIRVARAQPAPKSARRSSGAPANRSRAVGGPLRVPLACLRVPQAEWDAAAVRRGGTSNTLVGAVAARIGMRLDRVDADGVVTLAVPVSVRVEGDTRANALEAATIRIDPSDLAKDLTGLRAATKAALLASAEQSADVTAALSLVPLMPPSLVRRTEAVAMGAASSPVGCSNYGDMPDAVARIDGGDPDNVWVRLNELGQTADDLDRIGGVLYVLSWRTLGAVYLSVIARPVGGGLEQDELHEIVADTLGEFDLIGTSITR